MSRLWELPSILFWLKNVMYYTLHSKQIEELGASAHSVTSVFTTKTENFSTRGVQQYLLLHKDAHISKTNMSSHKAQHCWVSL